MGFVQAGAGIGMILPLTLLPFLADVFNVGGAFLMLPVLSAVVLSGVLAGLPSERIPQIRSASMSFRLLAGNRGFWCLVTYFFLGMLAYYAVMAWLPTFLRRDFSYSAVEAGLASTLVSIALVVGSPLAGLLSDSLQTRTPVLLVGSLMSVMAFVLFLFSADPKVVVGAGLLCGISMAFTVPVLIIVVGETFGAGLAGVTVSIAATAGQIASSLSGPLFGYVYQTSTAFAAVWGVALMIAAGSIPFLLLATKIIKQTKREGQKG
jgi:predicted MFS family arabinose efflux permease